LENIIRQTAVPLTTSQDCGGDGPTDVPNNVYGWGRIDALAAYNLSQSTGSLVTTLLPQEAVDAGAQWRVDQGAWRSSGQTASGLLIGQHLVEFKEVPPWRKPPNRYVTISTGQINSFSAAYLRTKSFSFPYLYLLLLD